MNILIIINFCSNYSETSNGRFIYLANILTSDNCVEIISSDFNHSKKTHDVYVPENTKYHVHILHETGYKTNVCVGRFVSHFVWALNVKKFINKMLKEKNIDVIYCAVPTTLAAYFAGKICKRHNIKFIVDIQDLWPEAFQMVFNIPVISKILFMPFKFIANSVYKMADEVIAVSQTYVDRAMKVNKKCREGLSVFLGTNSSTFNENVKNNMIESKPKDELWLGYCGTLGASCDLTCVFDALRLIKNKGLIPPKFIIMGLGPRAEEFKKKSKNLNVLFTGQLPYPKVCGLLASCDIAINPVMHNAAQSIINKHADYAAAGIPVINTQESLEYQSLVESYDMGINCKCNDPEDVAKAIELLMSDSVRRKRLGLNSRRCFEEKFDRSKTYPLLVSRITNS